MGARDVNSRQTNKHHESDGGKCTKYDEWLLFDAKWISLRYDRFSFCIYLWWLDNKVSQMISADAGVCFEENTFIACLFCRPSSFRFDSFIIASQ